MKLLSASVLFVALSLACAKHTGTCQVAPCCAAGDANHMGADEVCPLPALSESTAMAVKTRVEADLVKFKDAIEVAYDAIYNAGEGGSCDYKDDCKDKATIPGLSDCIGKPECLLQSLISATSSSITVPAGSADHPDLMKRICSLTGMDNQWKDNLAANPGDILQYFGDQKTGIAKWWPGRGRPADGCPATYDPRLRPWYSAAASGPKDVVIVIDTSGSMSSKQRMQKAQAAAKAVIKTLSWADYATVIGFSTKVEAATTTLIQATAANQAKLNTFVDDLVQMGKTNYEGAFSKAFDILESSKSVSSSKCNSIMLFLSDGEVTVGKDGKALRDAITAMNHADIDTRIFTYALGDDLTSDLMYRIACDNKGIFQQIGDDDSDKLAGIMAGYYGYFAAGIDSDKPRWSEIYYDSTNTDLALYTPGIPVYDTTKTPKVVLGVLALDIVASSMSNLTDYSTFQAAVLEGAKNCVDLELSDAEIQVLRADVGEASVCTEETSMFSDVQVVLLFIVFGSIFFICICKVAGGHKEAEKPPVDLEPTAPQARFASAPPQQVQMVQSPPQYNS